MSNKYINGKCVWNEDSDGVWGTACTKTFSFVEGCVVCNEFIFCPFCGAEIKSFPYAEEEGLDEDTERFYDEERALAALDFAKNNK